MKLRAATENFYRIAQVAQQDAPLRRRAVDEAVAQAEAQPEVAFTLAQTSQSTFRFSGLLVLFQTARRSWFILTIIILDSKW